MRIKSLKGALLASALISTTAIAPAVAQQEELGVFPIGYIDLADDPRFNPEYAYYYIPVAPLGESVLGAAMGIADALPISGVLGVSFALERHTGATIDDHIAAARQMVEEDGVHFILVDLPADQLLALSDAVADLPVTLFNLTAEEDVLRGESCRANTIHVIPSHQMLADALVQYLVSKRWRNILVFHGPNDEDVAMLDAVREAVSKFGARIVDERPIALSNDPRQQEQGNFALASSNAPGYDVAWVVDMDGEFARFYAPYQSVDPRPVVGSSGLVPLAWHWSWERQGAPQFEARFENNYGRRMDTGDWASWTGFKIISQAILRTDSTDYETLIDYILSDQLRADAYKAYPMSVRPWDHQLRQTVMLTTSNAVIGLAPVEGFQHQINDLDTLGVDEPQSLCEF